MLLDFSNYIFSWCCILKQANHRLTTNIQRRIYGHATDVEIRPLNEEKAVQAAGDLISELFVFTVLYFLLISPFKVIKLFKVLAFKCVKK